MPCPFYVLHYKPNRERRDYLRRTLDQTSLRPIYVEEMDAGEFPIHHFYRYDEATFTRMVMYFADNNIGTVIGLKERPTEPWANCIRDAGLKYRTVKEVLERAPWLRPQELTPAAVSLVLKHMFALRRIVQGTCDYAIVAEDDILLNDHSVSYLCHLLRNLPPDFDYVDLAGGLNLRPRIGNRLVNEHFYEIDPPRPRTTCCAIVHKRLAERLLQLNLPIVLGYDWLLLWAFKLLRTKVYWVEPLVFDHGSQVKKYPSTIVGP